MHLIHKHNRALRLQPVARVLRQLHRLADFLHTPQHRTDRQKLGVKRARHQAGDGGLADPGRPPQNATVGLPRLKRHPQGHARPQNVLLPDHLRQVAGPQTLGQRNVQATHGRKT